MGNSNDKRVAVIGANKDALALLPVVFSDPATRLVMMVDPNPDAMLFKLMELACETPYCFGRPIVETHSWPQRAGQVPMRQVNVIMEISSG